MTGSVAAGVTALAVDAAAAMVPGVAVAAGPAEPVADVARALAEQYCPTNPAA